MWALAPEVLSAAPNPSGAKAMVKDAGVKSPWCWKAHCHTRFKNLKLPSTAWSFHSRVASGGAVNMVYKRAVSAPYFSIKAWGSTPLFLLLLMVPTPS